MNAITQRNRLESQLKSYKDFVPFCPADGLLKLIGEMTKIIQRIDKIKELEIDELVKEVPFYFDIKQSKANFKTV